jgi:co-chaperonin GroES (HSP10)
MKAPEVSDCKPGIEPVDVMVLVAPIEAAKKIGSIYLPEGEEAERREFAEQRGRIIAASPMAFKFREWPTGYRAPQVGDLILHDKYGGSLIKGDDGRDYRLMKDIEVKAVLERAKEAAATGAEAIGLAVESYVEQAA